MRLGPPVLTTAQFPDDADTTSLGITVFNRPSHVAHLVMNKMLQYRTSDGLMQVRDDIRRRCEVHAGTDILIPSDIFHRYQEPS